MSLGDLKVSHKDLLTMVNLSKQNGSPLCLCDEAYCIGAAKRIHAVSLLKVDPEINIHAGQFVTPATSKKTGLQ